MSSASEDTMAVLDISPYPESIDSNEGVQADCENREDEAQSDEWEFRCVCGVQGHNYDDGRPMVQCCECNCWLHTDCVNYDVNSNDEFVCKWCREKKAKKPSMK